MPSRSTRRNSEAALSNSVRKALAARGCWVMRLQSGAVPITSASGVTRYMHSGEPGCSDLIVMYPETKDSKQFAVAFAEIKTATGRLSKESSWPGTTRHARAAFASPCCAASVKRSARSMGGRRGTHRR